MRNDRELEEFEIPFVKLKDGLHQYAFDLRASFFETLGFTLAGPGTVKANLAFDKKQHLFQLDMEVEGAVSVSCDRCLEPLSYPVKAAHRVMVKQRVPGERETTSGLVEVDDDLLEIAHTEISINVAPLFFDLVVLALPIIRNCDELPQKPCNQDMLERLAELAAPDANNKETDPRWEGLKDLFKDPE